MQVRLEYRLISSFKMKKNNNFFNNNSKRKNNINQTNNILQIARISSALNELEVVQRICDGATLATILASNIAAVQNRKASSSGLQNGGKSRGNSQFTLSCNNPNLRDGSASSSSPALTFLASNHLVSSLISAAMGHAVLNKEGPVNSFVNGETLSVTKAEKETQTDVNPWGRFPAIHLAQGFHPLHQPPPSAMFQNRHSLGTMNGPSSMYQARANIQYRYWS